MLHGGLMEWDCLGGGQVDSRSTKGVAAFIQGRKVSVIGLIYRYTDLLASM